MNINGISKEKSEEKKKGKETFSCLPKAFRF